MKLLNLYFFIIGICCLFLTGQLFAQQNKNPFELTPRIPTEQHPAPASDNQTQNPFDIVENETGDAIIPSSPKEEKGNLEDSTPAIEDSASTAAPSTNNPFEITTTNSIDNIQNIPTVKPSKTDNPIKTSPIVFNGRLLNGVIFFMLVVLALLASLFRTTLNKSFRAFFNDNLLGQIYREQNSGVTIPYLLFYILFLFNTGIFTFLLLRHFNINLMPSKFSGILGTILVVSIVLVLKLLILWLMGKIYPIEKETKLYSFTVIIFSIVSGILLIPANILIAYASDDITQYAIYGVFIGLGIIYLLRSLRGVLIANRFLLFHKFHFLLYICTIEIAPVIILFKFI